MTVAPTIFVTKPTLVGRLVTLRPFGPDDVATMAEILTDPDVNRLTGSVHSTAEAEHAAADVEALRAWYTSRNDQDDRLDLAIVDNGTDAGARPGTDADARPGTGPVVGEVVLNEWDEANASCNFRILVGPAGRGRGLGTEATELLLDYAFGALGLHRVSLGVFAFNPRARHVYEKVGFVTEGVEREALRFDGAWVDSIRMAVLAHEWAARRG